MDAKAGLLMLWCEIGKTLPPYSTDLYMTIERADLMHGEYEEGGTGLIKLSHLEVAAITVQ
ncbi:unnamed protein product [Clavelina lepadiformis]|uniref:Uncharacterized protein n=1 Tax=Clavelina lepadiformis TaxID=159417 RepID=A0ABP0G3A6_CLALP